MLLESGRPDGIEDSKGSESVNVSSVLGHLERDLDVRLSSQVVDLSGLRSRSKGGRGREISLSSADGLSFSRLTRTWVMMETRLVVSVRSP